MSSKCHICNSEYQANRGYKCCYCSKLICDKCIEDVTINSPLCYICAEKLKIILGAKVFDRIINYLKPYEIFTVLSKGEDNWLIIYFLDAEEKRDRKVDWVINQPDFGSTLSYLLSLQGIKKSAKSIIIISEGNAYSFDPSSKGMVGYT